MNMSNNKLKVSILAATLFTATTILSGCGNVEANGNEDKAVETITSIPVETSTISLGAISENYVSTAILEAKEEAFVVARASGIIEKIHVEEGDYVEKGQVLAQLDKRRYQLSLQKAQADLKGIEQELAKIDKVYMQKLVSDDTYEKLQSQFESAKATLALAKLDLEETTIVAPISGYIAERNAKVGNLTESFQRERMFHIVQQKELQGVVHLPESELPHIEKNQIATMTIAALGNKEVTGYVARVSPVISADTGTFKVTLNVPNENEALKAGMFSEVKINYETKDHATLIPRRAVVMIDNQPNVFVVDQGVVTKTPVQLGFSEGDVVEAVSGVNINAEVVITGHQNLKDQAPVEVVNG